MSESQYVLGPALQPYDVVVWSDGSIVTVLDNDRRSSASVVAGAHYPPHARNFRPNGRVDYAQGQMFLVLFRTS